MSIGDNVNVEVDVSRDSNKMYVYITVMGSCVFKMRTSAWIADLPYSGHFDDNRLHAPSRTCELS